jgi:hypothetical protein
MINEWSTCTNAPQRANAIAKQEYSENEMKATQRRYPDEKEREVAGQAVWVGVEVRWRKAGTRAESYRPETVISGFYTKIQLL